MRSYFISPKEQLKMAAIAFLGLLAVLGFHTCVLLSVVLHRLDMENAGLSEILGPELIFSAIIWFLVMSISGGLFIFVLNIVYSHRVYGSLFAIQANIKKALNGEKVFPIRRRSEDQTGQLVETVNELIQRYQDKP
jgi:hypothetical protein